jgi:MFS family permease
MNRSLSWFPALHPQVWWQVLGRLLYQIGQGMLQFYIPIIFVNEIGLSATSVGIGLGSSSISGVVGHLLGGAFADSRLGRKGTLLLSAALSTLACGVLIFTQDLPLLIAANLLFGFSTGFYWTATDPVVMDVTTTDDRPPAFAILGVADNLGMGAGVLVGGWLLLALSDKLQLFAVDGLIFLAQLLLLQLVVVETRQAPSESEHTPLLQGWRTAFSDKMLWVFVLINSLFTTYIALINTALPLYFTNHLRFGPAGIAASAQTIASLFTWGYIGLGAVLQVPIVQWLGRLGWIRALTGALALWSSGFLLIWLLGTGARVPWLFSLVVLATLASATVIYRPFAATFLAELAPASLRGAYAAIGYQCWAIGYFVGPTLGGWALDQPSLVLHHFWLAIGFSTTFGFVVLWLLSQRQPDAFTIVSFLHIDTDKTPKPRNPRLF